LRQNINCRRLILKTAEIIYLKISDVSATAVACFELKTIDATC